MKALSNNLQQQLADQSHKKTARVGIPDKLAEITNTHDAVWKIKVRTVSLNDVSPSVIRATKILTISIFF